MKKGYFLIEALLSIVIFSVLILSLFSMVSFLQRRVNRSTYEAEAARLLQDGIEIARSAILADWGGYADTSYFPAFDNDSESWILLPGEEAGLEVRFSRKIELRQVCRDSSTGVLLSYSQTCSGEPDPLSREVVTTVWWNEAGQERQINAKLLVLNTND